MFFHRGYRVYNTCHRYVFYIHTIDYNAVRHRLCLDIAYMQIWDDTYIFGVCIWRNRIINLLFINSYILIDTNFDNKTMHPGKQFWRTSSLNLCVYSKFKLIQSWSVVCVLCSRIDHTIMYIEFVLCDIIASGDWM